MSSLWTPGGEHPVEPDAAPSDPTGPQMDPEADPLAGLSDDERAQAEANMVVANHAMGLYELAAIHLSEEDPDLTAARLAIDAMGQLVDGLSGRLGEAEATLKDALAQLRMAFVQVSEQAAGGDAPEG